MENISKVKKISGNIWKVIAGSNVYFLDLPEANEKIIIDTGERSEQHILRQFLSKLVDFNEVTKVIFTHLHYDHIGNFDLFPNAKFYASRQEIRDFRNDAVGTVLVEDMAQKFSAARLIPAEELDIKELEVINTPGHTKGGICLWLESESILFTGDTIFLSGYGRTDLPTSAGDKMQGSVIKLLNYNYKIMCPGHDY